MVVSLSNIPKQTNVYRFITSGKPGDCTIPSHKGNRFTEKLEAHHVCYNPEITTPSCHNCHHKVHFWPQRLTPEDILFLLRKRFHYQTALKIFRDYKGDTMSLRNLIAPSKSGFLKKHQKLDIKRISPKHDKVYKTKKAKINKGVLGSKMRRESRRVM